MSEDIQSNVTLRYLIAAIGLSSVTIVAIVVVTVFRPEHDNSGIITTILAVSTATYPGLASFIRGQANNEELKKAKALADRKAEEIKRAVDETNRVKEQHLNRQDEMIETVKEKVEEMVNKTNGMIEEVKQKAHREGHASGEKAALTKLGMEPKRTTDLE